MSKVITTIIVILLILIFWHAIVAVFNISTYVFPSPLKVLESLAKHWQVILSNAKVTFIEAFLGFLIANLISVLIALAVSFYRKTENIVMPFAIFLKTIPIIAMAPLLVIWFGPGVPSKVVAAMLVCFFPALVNVLRGVKSLDRKLLELFKIYSVTKIQLIRMLILPSIAPYLFSALKVSSSLAVVGALVGEFIGSNQGLGFLIMSNYYNMNIPLVFATISVSSIIGISFYYAIHFFEKKMVIGQEAIVQGRNTKGVMEIRYLERR